MNSFVFWVLLFVVVGSAYITVRAVSAPFRRSRCCGERLHYSFVDDVDRCDRCNMAHD